MRVIEQSEDRLIIHSQTSFWTGLLFSTIFILGGLFLCLIGLTFPKFGLNEVMPIGMGCVFIIGGLIATKISASHTYTFDKSQDTICWERRSLLKPIKVTSVEFPFHLIAGVEIEAVSGDEGGINYYPRLLLKSVYWRIPLSSNGQYQSTINIAKSIATFLQIPYFSDTSKAPAQTFLNQISENLEPWRFSWQYLEDEVERLQQHLHQYPSDAESHQNLGLSLYYLNKWLNRQVVISHLQQAEQLFESQQECDRATIAKIIKTMISWNY